MLLCTKSDSVPQMEILRVTVTAEKYKIYSVAAIRAPCSEYRYQRNWKGQGTAVAYLQK